MKNTLLSCHKAKRVKIQNLNLKIPDNFEEYPDVPHFSESNSCLIHLDLSSCGINTKKLKMLMVFVTKCQKLEHLCLRHNKIETLSSITIPEEDFKSPRLIIDLRSNKIKCVIKKSVAEYLENCTLLLWNNPFVELNRELMEENPYHIYVADDQADTYFEELIYM